MSLAQALTPNLLLRTLPSEDYALIEPHLERVQLHLRAPLFDPNTPIAPVFSRKTV